MSDVTTLLPETPEDERIRKWREDRLKVAQEEKAERLRQRDEARVREAEVRQTAEAEAALALLPTAAEIEATQTQINKRLLRSRAGFWFQFLCLCVLPVALTGYYLFAVATPLYEARSVIAVTNPGSATDTSNSGLLGSLQSPSKLQEVFMAHEYIKSQAIMESLEDRRGLVSFLSSDAVDPLQRLRSIPDVPYDKRQQFSRFVESAVDIQTGLVTLYVRSPDQEEAVETTNLILDLVATQVNTLNGDIISQRLDLASKTVEGAQAQLTAAQKDLVTLQLESGEIDPAERIAGIYGIIDQLETEALALNHEVQRAEVSGQANAFQKQRKAELYDRLMTQVETQRALLVAQDNDGRPSLNTLMMQHQLATLRVEIAEEALTASLTAQATASHQAALGSSLFQVVVPPRTSALPTVPNAFATLLVVLVGSLAVFSLIRMAVVGRQFR